MSGAAVEPLPRCPACGGALAGEAAPLCAGCGHAYEVRNGIPLLFLPDEGAPAGDPTAAVRAFYEDAPFPNYDGLDDAATLIDRARRGRFAQMLDDAIPFGAAVLECGCGTGQLTNFLSLGRRMVYGADMCVASLELAEAFRRRNALERARFVQMNLFRPAFAPGSFDVVLSMGVLHHTGDPRGGLRRIAALVRPGGYLVVGLYHRYGRLATRVRRVLFRLGGARFHRLDPVLPRLERTPQRWRAWFRDQYQHPHESTHTILEVRRWLLDAGLHPVRSIPSVASRRDATEGGGLFDPEPFPGRAALAAREMAMAWWHHRDGGLFVMIARRGEEGTEPSVAGG